MRLASPHRHLLHDARSGSPADGVSPAMPVAAQPQLTVTPSLADRARVSLRHGGLDHRIASGESISVDRGMTVRAWQLTRPRMRRQLADSLERVVHDSDEMLPGEKSDVKARHLEVRVARGELLWLAARLRDDRPARAQGVALVSELLTDGNSPLYMTGTRHELWRAVHAATEALD
ncbi:MAG TPA: hypothetical protein VGM91_07285 [Conexibacter sp.]|jgi:hypothetical protein